MSARTIGGTLTPEALSLLAGKKPARSEVLALLDRARYCVERDWTAAALDPLSLAIRLLQPTSTPTNE